MYAQALLYKVDCLARLFPPEHWLPEINELLPVIDVDSPELVAHYERILASACVAAGDRDAALTHYARASRLCRALENVPAQVELAAMCPDLAAAEGQEADAPGRPSPASVLHAVACVLANSGRPEIVGRELLAVLKNCGCLVSGSLVGRALEGGHAPEVIDACGETPPDPHAPRTLALGTARGRHLTLHLYAQPTAEALASINAVAQLIASLQEIQQARVEREERATLWPVDELPVEGDRTVLAGHMREVMTQARRVARTKVSVLVIGESGTGKEILARAIHDYSDRAQKPFVPVNCAAVPRELLESQLFGHRRGAFTGADRDHAGFIRAAEGGTLFLDEIGELGLDLQPKLLRFLESCEIAPLGETSPVIVNVRIVAATNRSLDDLVREGRFREDLFYRLNVVHLTINPLRERRDEIPGLVQYFVERAAAEFNKGRLTVAEETIERLLLYRWPGNVRQLQNEIRRMVALAEPDSTLGPEDISETILSALPLRRDPPTNGSELAVSLHEKLPMAIARVEMEMIKQALRDHRGKVDEAARALGISRKGLYLKRQRLGL